MMQIKRQTGFALLEVLLAIILLVAASYGVYSLYHATQQSYDRDRTLQEIKQIAASYTQLSQGNLTQGLTTPSDFVQLLYNANRLPDNYFMQESDASSLALASPFGIIDVVSVSPAQVQLRFPVGATNFSERAGYCEEVAAAVAACTPVNGSLLGAKHNQILITLQAGG